MLIITCLIAPRPSLDLPVSPGPKSVPNREPVPNPKSVPNREPGPARPLVPSPRPVPVLPQPRRPRALSLLSPLSRRERPRARRRLAGSWS